MVKIQRTDLFLNKERKKICRASVNELKKREEIPVVSLLLHTVLAWQDIICCLSCLDAGR